MASLGNLSTGCRLLSGCTKLTEVYKPIDDRLHIPTIATESALVDVLDAYEPICNPPVSPLDTVFHTKIVNSQ